jgi:UDP-N-acetylmuramate dehydrogenase
MKITENASLQSRNTLALPAVCHRLIEIEKPCEVKELPVILKGNSDVLVLGAGSNIVLVDSEYPHTVITQKPPPEAANGIHPVSLDEHRTQLVVAAAVPWNDLVLWSVDKGLGGIENLAAIPGSCGAAPVQNIGAYGVELKDVLDWVEVYDWQRDRFMRFTQRACQFGYRDSLFKQHSGEPWLITRLALTLRNDSPVRLEYAGIREQLDAMGIAAEKATPAQVAQAITAIRERKLPSPESCPNAGSFFKNPVVSATELHALKRRFGELPHWPLPNGQYKVSAAWLIEQLGLSGCRVGDAGFYPRHALIVVNNGRATGKEIQQLSVAVKEKVRAETGICLQVEPRLLRAQ